MAASPLRIPKSTSSFEVVDAASPLRHIPKSLSSQEVVAEEADETGGGASGSGALSGAPHRAGWSALDLSNRSLRSLSVTIGLCYPWLKRIDACSNKIRFVDSAVLLALPALESLNLAANEIRELGDGWGRLGSLRALNLARNAIAFVPPDFGRLFLLDALDLTANPVVNIPGEVVAKTDASVVFYLRDTAAPPPPPASRSFVFADRGRAPSTERSAFTLFSYNILCDAYATATMHPHTPAWALAWPYRKGRALQEILLSQADVICVQELQLVEFDTWLLPELTRYGYDGRIKIKSRAKTMHPDRAQLVDGCATFWRRAKFALEAVEELEYAAIAMADASLRASDDAFTRLMTRDNVALLLTLRASNGTQLVVANTHIHFDPRFSDVKVVQVLMLLHAAAAKHVRATVLCGDFNSLPLSGVYELLANGRLARDHADLRGVSYGSYTTAELRHALKLQSAYASVTGTEPLFTNFTHAFRGTIDYVWGSTALRPEAVLLTPSREDAEAGVALPSAHFPSDHVSLMVRYSFE